LGVLAFRKNIKKIKTGDLITIDIDNKRNGNGGWNMTEGFWINYSRGKVVKIHEHENDIRKLPVVKKLGLTEKDMDGFAKFQPGRDRERFLLWLMKTFPLMRVRGHGMSVTFDFDSRRRQQAIDSIYEFGQNNLGPFSQMVINNYATRESVHMSFHDFEGLFESDGAEGILRVGAEERTNARILRELRKIATVIDMGNILQR